jgi:PDZ domain-containing protein
MIGLRRVRPLHLALAGLGLVVAVFLILWEVPSDNYLLLPDKAHPAAPLVHVQGAKGARRAGAIYFVDLIEERASLWDSLFPGLRDGATLVPASALISPGASEQTQHHADLAEMARSQQIAAAVALRTLGYKVVARPIGVLVDAAIPDSGAFRKLEPADLIISLGGSRTLTTDRLHAALGRHRVGQVVDVGVRRGSRIVTLKVKTTPSQSNPKFPALGVYVEQATHVRLPLGVSIDTGNIGGPSAGLAFALEIVQKLGHDVTHGYRVAATGALLPDGTVIPIGGVRQKILGVREAGADVFLVPAGDNYATAKRYSGHVRVLPVHNFRQALRLLATLPPKA